MWPYIMYIYMYIYILFLYYMNVKGPVHGFSWRDLAELGLNCALNISKHIMMASVFVDAEVC